MPAELTATMMRRLRRAERKVEALESLLEDKSRKLYVKHMELERSRDQLQRILDVMIGGVLLVDQELRVVWSNRELARMVGEESAALRGRGLAEIMPSVVAEPWPCVLTEQLPLRDFEVSIVCRGGEPVPVSLSIAPLVEDPAGSFVCVVLDLSHRRELERALMQASKLESLGRLAAGVAHELNTPVQFVSDNVDFLGDGMQAVLMLAQAQGAVVEAGAAAGVDPQMVERVRALQRESDVDYLREETPVALEELRGGLTRITRIVRSISEMAHPGQGREMVVDVNHVVENAIAISRNEWKYVAQLQTRLHTDLPPMSGFPEQLGQALLNLLVNAAHAVAAAGRKAEGDGCIEVWTGREGSQIVVGVRDNGCGIEPGLADKIFEPFFTTKEPGKGTGQGLSIVRAIVEEAHGGRLELDSTPGEGTSIVLRFPEAA